MKHFTFQPSTTMSTTSFWRNSIGISSMTILLLALLSVAPIPVAAIGATVLGVQAAKSSMMGGAYLTIWGSGFWRDGREGRTVVFVGIDECDVVEYDSTDSKLVCYTPKAPSMMEGGADVKVAILSIDGQQEYAACPSPNACRVTYSWGVTPKIDQGSLGGTPGSIYRAIGQVYGDTVTPYHISIGTRAGSGVGTQGGSRCAVEEEVQPGNTNDLMDWTGSGNIRCTVGDAEAGRYNISFELRDNAVGGQGYGQAFWRRATKQVNPIDGSIFQYTQRPHISSTSYAVTGLQGGSELTITGSGFSSRKSSTNSNNPPANEVFLFSGNAGGSSSSSSSSPSSLTPIPCKIISESPTQITCRPGAAMASSPSMTNLSSTISPLYPSGTGLLHSVYLNRHVWTGTNVDPLHIGNIPDIQFVNSDSVSGYYNNEADMYGQVLSGLFVPPVTANYSFYTRGDDWISVYLSTDSTPANAKPVVVQIGWSTSFWGSATTASAVTQVSAPQFLQANTPYYIRIQHQEGVGGDSFDMALRVHTENNAAATAMLRNDNQAVFRSTPEVQNIRLAANVVREKQRIRLTGAAGGTWGIKVAGTTTLKNAALATSLPFNATGDDVSSAHVGGAGCNSFTATRAVFIDTLTNSSGFEWSVTWNCPISAAGTTWPLVQVFSTSLQPLPGKEIKFLVDRVALPSDPLDGTFTLTWNNTVTAPLSYSASAADVANQLLALPGIEDVEVSIVSAGTNNPRDGRIWQITFWNPAGNQPSVIANIESSAFNGITGSSPTTFTIVLHEGSYDPFYWPAPMDWFQTALPVSGILVKSNGIAATCDVHHYNGSFVGGGRTVVDSSCSFRYDNSLTPTITSVSPTTGTAGTVLTVTGTGFLTASAGVGKGLNGANLAISDLNFVYVGGKIPCIVTAATTTQLTCTLSDGFAGIHNVTVELGFGNGFAAVDASVTSGLYPTLTYPLSITAVSPISGSRAGGTLVSLNGTGFQTAAEDNIVTIGGVACTVVQSSVTGIVCRTSVGTSATAAIVVNSLTVLGFTFDYSVAKTPTVTSMSRSSLSSATSNYIRFVVANAPADASVNIYFAANDSRECRLVNSSTISSGGGDREIFCLLMRTAASADTQGPFAPHVIVEGFGNADATGLSLDTGFRVSSVSPSTGSLQGGTLVTITGVGFTGRLTSTSVNYLHQDPMDADMLHKLECRIRTIAADGTSLQCVAGQPDMYTMNVAADATSLAGTWEVTVNKFSAPCLPASSSSSPSVCSYTYALSATPIVTSVETSVDNSQVILRGTNLDGPVHVWFGTYMAADSAVTVNSDKTAVTVSEVPLQAAGSVGIYAHSVPRGNIRITNPNITYTYPLLVSVETSSNGTASSSLRGSVAGGYEITLVGTGFSSSLMRNQVLFGGVYPGMVMSANITQLTVHTPSLQGLNVVSSGSSKALDISVSILDVSLKRIVASTLPSAIGVYTFDDASTITPIIRRVTPPAGTPGLTVIRIEGTGFGGSAGAPPAKSSVRIGGADCSIDVVTWTPTAFNCTVGATTPGGSQKVLVTIGSVGMAKPFSASPSAYPVFTVAARITSVSPSTIGVGGGAPITITGSGFADTDSTGATNAVTVCGATCDLTTISSTSLTCTPRAVVTADSLDAYTSTYELTTLTGSSIFGTSLTQAAFAFDGNVDTMYRSCMVGMDMGANARAIVTRVRFYPRFRSTGQFGGSIFSASEDGTSWTTLTTVTTAIVNEGWNYVDIVNGPNQPFVATLGGSTPSYRYLRWNAASGTDCTGMEVQFVGYQVAASKTGACTVNVTVTAPLNDPYLPGAPVVAVASVSSGGSAALSVSFSSTPFVSSISPSFGTALGGTTVVLTGTGFPTVPSYVTVALNGMSCTVTASTATSITCITSKRTSIIPPSVQVNVAGKGLAVYDLSRTYFRYLDKWSDVTTWADQEPPVEGDTVIVPIGQAILVDISPPKLFVVLVQGEMVFDRKDLTFDASYILVHGGTLEVGTEAQPFMNKLTITLHGDRYTSIELPEVGAKVLAVMNRGEASHAHADMSSMSSSDSMSGAMEDLTTMSLVMADMMGTDHGMDMSALSMSSSPSSSLGGFGAMHADMPGVAGAPAPTITQGVLDIHGAPRLRVWTKVAATVVAGSTTITTAEDVDWVKGETIVITSSSHDYSEAEELVVLSRPNSRTIIVESPVQYTHESQVVDGSIYGHSDIDMRCEVGLLTRNVKIQGDDTSFAQAFGVHTGAFHGGLYRLENAELFHCGQSNNLGRYCSHYHMHGDAVDGYIRSNSIHHSFQRATTIHGTNHLRVMHNFGYNIRGHSIFVEDGIERFNVIEGNLIAVTLRCFACLKSDTKPASFWTASPTNFWRHNVAAGCQNDGYWFEPPGNPHGPSYTPTYCPIGSPVGQHLNNTAHSNGVHGLRIYPAYTPYVDPCNENSGPSPQYFHNFTSFRNAGHGIFGKLNGDLHHINPKLVENGDDEFFQMKYLGNVNFTWNPNIRNGLMIATLDPVNRPAGDKRAIFAPQQEYWFVDGATIVNYQNRGALAGCADCDTQTQFRQGGYTYRWKGLSFINSAVRTFWAPPRKDIFWDLDGSLTNNVGGGYVIPHYNFNDWPECPKDTVGTFSGGNVCGNTVQVRRLQIDGHSPTQLDFQTLNITSLMGSDDVLFRPKETYGWTFPVVNTHWYDVQFKSLIDWRTLRIRYSEPEYLVPGEWTGTRWSWTDTRYRIRSLYRGSSTMEIDPLPAGVIPTSADIFGQGNMPTGPLNNTWSVMLSTNLVNNTDPMKDKMTSFMFTAAAIQCAPRGCSPPADSDLGPPKLWSDPLTWGAAGLPTAGSNVRINSTVYVIMDINPPRLNNLVIEGRLEFKDSEARSLTAASIVVWGSLIVGTPEAPFLNNAEILLTGTRTSPSVAIDNNLFVGNKVLVALGRVSLHGAPRSTTWLKLNATAAAGSTSMRLQSSVANVWFPNDVITITPTEYAYTQVETLTISSISPDGRTVTFTPPLAFTHFAGFAGTSAITSAIRLAAAVGVLSRNVVIRGELSDPAADTYGGHVFVSVVKRTINNVEIVRQGTLDARFVEFRNMGKGAMEYGSITFQYGNFDLDASTTPDATSDLDDNGYNTLIGNSFSFSFNYGVVATHARHLFIDKNVFHRTVRNGIETDKDSINVTITSNLFSGNYKSPDVNAPGQMLWIAPQAAVFLNVVPRLLANNYVGGAYDAAYTFRGEDCSNAASPFMSNNEAASVLIGVFVLPTWSASGCTLATGFTVWKAAHIGILTVDQQRDFKVTRSVVSDSHLGVSFNFVYGKKGEARSDLVDVLVLASSPASADCAASSICRAMTMADITATSGVCGSVLGPGFRRAGVMLPQYTNRGKTCEVDGTLPVCRPVNRPERLCGFPWERRFGLPSTRNTRMYLTRVAFVGFGGAGSDCALDSRAIVHNPTQTDMAVPVLASGIVWENTPQAGRFWFGESTMTNGKCADGQGCDSFNFLLFHDVDGSLTGTSKSTILGPNPMIAEPSPTCEYVDAWHGTLCRGIVYRAAVIENMDRDRGHRKLGSIQFTRPDVLDARKNRTSTSMGPVDDGCAMRFYFGQYAFAVRPNQQTTIMLPSTEPGQTRLHFLSSDPTEKALIRMFIQRPNSLDFFVDGARIAPKTVNIPSDMPSLSDPIGTNIFDPKARYVSLVLGGSTSNTLGAGAVWFDLVRSPSIQLTLKLSVSVDTFFGASLVQSIALLLGIPSNRIKVVDVQAADSVIGRRLSLASGRMLTGGMNSTDVKLEILPDTNAIVLVTDVTDNTTTTASIASQQAMVDLASLVTSFVDSGHLQSTLQADLGYAVAGVVVVAPSIAIAAPPTVPSAPTEIDPSADSSTSSLSSGAIAGIVIGILVVGGAILAAGLLLKHTSASALLATAEASSSSSSEFNTSKKMVPIEQFVLENPTFAHSPADSAAPPAVELESPSPVLGMSAANAFAAGNGGSSSGSAGNRQSVRVAPVPTSVGSHHHAANARPAWRK